MSRAILGRCSGDVVGPWSLPDRAGDAHHADVEDAAQIPQGGGRFMYSVVASPLHDAVTVGELTAPVRTLMERLGGGNGAVERDPASPYLYLVATGGTERALLDLVARRRVVQPHEPVVLVAHGAHNSLPAALEALAAIRQHGGRGRIAFLPGDGSDGAVLEEAVVDLEAISRFRTARLGIVGGPSDWLVASSPSADVVRRRWGPHLETVASTQMVELSRHPADIERTAALAARFTSTADPERTIVSPMTVGAAAAVGTALADVVADEQFDAVAVRCFDLLGDPGTSGCLALASLNDEGVVAGCEGDVPSTLAMMMVRYLLDQPSWMANPAHIDVDANQVVLAHCTVAPSMTESIGLSTHFESGLGVGISGRFAPQAVTLVRIGGVDLDQRWIAEGRIVASGDDPDLCRTQVTVELDDHSVSELLECPLGNHLTLVRGAHGARLERWWSLAIGDR